MEISDYKYYLRVTAILAKAWGMTPRDVMERCENEEVAIEEALESLLYEGCFPFMSEAIQTFLNREGIEQKKKVDTAITRLSFLASKTDDIEKKKELCAEIEKIKNNPKKIKLVIK